MPDGRYWAHYVLVPSQSLFVFWDFMRVRVRTPILIMNVFTAAYKHYSSKKILCVWSLFHSLKRILLTFYEVDSDVKTYCVQRMVLSVNVCTFRNVR